MAQHGPTKFQVLSPDADEDLDQVEVKRPKQCMFVCLMGVYSSPRETGKHLGTFANQEKDGQGNFTDSHLIICANLSAMIFQGFLWHLMVKEDKIYVIGGLVDRRPQKKRPEAVESQMMTMVKACYRGCLMSGGRLCFFPIFL
jgi:hypothetical protein